MVKEGLKKVSKIIKEFLLKEGANSIFYQSYVRGVVYKDTDKTSFVKWSTPTAVEDLTEIGKKKKRRHTNKKHYRNNGRVRHRYIRNIFRGYSLWTV